MSQPIDEPTMPYAANETRQQLKPAKPIAIIIIVTIALVVRLPFVTQAGFGPDIAQFAWWGQLAAERGMAAVYDPPHTNDWRDRPCNLPPLHIYGFAAMVKLFPFIAGEAFDYRIMLPTNDSGVTSRVRAVAHALFKAPAVLADLVTAALLLALIHRRCSARFAWIVALLYALHPAVIHNSVRWGQIDSIHTLLMLLSLGTAVSGHVSAMSAWAALGVLAKPQAIVLAPVWVVVILFHRQAGSRRQRMTSVAKAIATAALVAATVVAPFVASASAGRRTETLAHISDVYRGAVGHYPVVHLNGFSAWFLLNPMPQPHLEAMNVWYQRDDKSIAGPLTPRIVGLILLAATAAYGFWRLARQHCDTTTIYWAGCVLPLAFFVLPTQIHERYLYPCIALWAWSARPTRGWWAAWIAIGVVAYVNMIWVWRGIAASAQTGPPPFGGFGFTLGVACSLAMLVVLIVALLRGPPRNNAAPG